MLEQLISDLRDKIGQGKEIRKWFILAENKPQGYFYVGMADVYGEKIKHFDNCPNFAHSHIYVPLEYLLYFYNLGLVF